MWSPLLLTLLLWPVLAGCAREDAAPPPTGRVAGVVVDESERPIVGALLVVVKTTSDGPVPEIVPITNDEGRFTWNRLPAGEYTFRASAEGYRPGEQTAQVRAGQTAAVGFVLKR